MIGRCVPDVTGNPRPSYINIGESPLPKMAAFNTEVIKELDKEFAMLQSQPEEEFQMEKIMTYLRIRPCKSLGPFEVKNDTDLLVHCPTSRLYKVPSDKMENEMIFSFNKVWGPDSTQTQVFEDSVIGALEKVLKGENCLIFGYGATNSGKTHTLQGYGIDFGIVPRTLDFIFNQLEDTLYQNCNIKPLMFDQYSCLTEKEVEGVIETKERILNSINKQSDVARNAMIFRESLCLSENSIVHRPCNDIVSAPAAEVISLEEESTVFSIWVSFAELYNEKIYDLFDVNPKKPKELKLQSDKNGHVYIKDLTEVFVSSAEEAYKLFLAGKSNLRFAATEMNKNSSRSHCFFSVQIITLGKTNGNTYPKSINRVSFCDLAGAERAAQTGNVGNRLAESNAINNSLMTLLRCIRAIRDLQTKKTTSTDYIPFRANKLTRLFQAHLTCASHIRMIVNINPDPRSQESTIQILHNSAIASQITAFRKVERPVNSTSFYKKVRDSINLAETMRKSLSPMPCPLNEEFEEPAATYDCQTIVAKKFAKPMFTAQREPSDNYVFQLEAEIASLKESLADRDDEVCRLRTLVDVLEETDAASKNKADGNISASDVLKDEQLALHTKAVEERYLKEIHTLKKRFAKGLVLSDDFETCSSGSDNEDGSSQSDKHYTLPSALRIQNKRVDVLKEANEEFKEGVGALQKTVDDKKSEIISLQLQLIAKDELYNQACSNNKALLKIKDEEIATLLNQNAITQKEDSLVQLSGLTKEVERLQNEIQILRSDLVDGETTCLAYDQKLSEANTAIAELTDALNVQMTLVRKSNEELSLLHESYELLMKKHDKSDQQSSKCTIGTVTTPTLNRSSMSCPKKLVKRKGAGATKTVGASSVAKSAMNSKTLQNRKEDNKMSTPDSNVLTDRVGVLTRSAQKKLAASGSSVTIRPFKSDQV